MSSKVFRTFFAIFDVKLRIGKIISKIFYPLGFSDWRIPTALITGFIAKETVVSTFAVLMGAGVSNIHSLMGSVFTPLTAFVFLVFILLYTPCVATISVIRKEMNSTRIAMGVAVLQTIIAWIFAFLVYRLGLLIFS